MNNPTSWDDIEQCACNFCRLLSDVRHDLKRNGGVLFVIDARMHGAGFSVTDCDALFVEPASIGQFETIRDSVALVLDRQVWCDVLVNSEPTTSHDDDWTKQRFLRAMFQKKNAPAANVVE